MPLIMSCGAAVRVSSTFKRPLYVSPLSGMVFVDPPVDLDGRKRELAMTGGTDPDPRISGSAGP